MQFNYLIIHSGVAMEKEVKQIVVNILQIEDRADTLTLDSGLIGAIPEFDSMAVVSVITAIEENFGFVVDDDEITAETFETLGSLVSFVESKM